METEGFIDKITITTLVFFSGVSTGRSGGAMNAKNYRLDNSPLLYTTGIFWRIAFKQNISQSKQWHIFICDEKSAVHSLYLTQYRFLYNIFK